MNQNQESEKDSSETQDNLKQDNPKLKIKQKKYQIHKRFTKVTQNNQKKTTYLQIKRQLNQTEQ